MRSLTVGENIIYLITKNLAALFPLFNLRKHQPKPIKITQHQVIKYWKEVAMSSLLGKFHVQATEPDINHALGSELVLGSDDGSGIGMLTGGIERDRDVVGRRPEAAILGP